MGDSTSAGLFGQFFVMLAENPTKDHKRIARNLWRMMPEYDFCEEEMGADNALIALGLAEKGDDGMEYADANATLEASAETSSDDEDSYERGFADGRRKGREDGMRDAMMVACEAHNLASRICELAKPYAEYRRHELVHGYGCSIRVPVTMDLSWLNPPKSRNESK